jgi:8-oxo-dGTP diphosphatase
MSAIRDDNGRSLSDYPRPNLAVDAILLSVYRGRLCVVLHADRELRWSLPGTFVREGETLITALNRGLAEKLELAPIQNFRQLHVFDAPDRDPRGWVFSVAHYALVREDVLDVLRPKQVIPLETARDIDLRFDHNEMLAMAVTRLREEYAERPDPWDVLGRFTLSELRKLHETIDPSTLLRDTFRRVMEPQLIEDPDARPESPTVGRPSRIWRIPTSEERLWRKFADQEAASMKRVRSSDSRKAPRIVAEGVVARLMAPERPAPRASDSETGTQAECRVVFHWQDGSEVTHEHLRERDAHMLIEDFAREVQMSRASGEEMTKRPSHARLLGPEGEMIRLEKF